MEIEAVTPRRLRQASILCLPLNVSDVGATLPSLAAGLSTEVKAGLAGFLENNKLQSLAGQHPDVLENSNPNVRKRKRIEFLREIQGQHDEIQEKISKERAALEAEYRKFCESLFTERYEIVNGVVEVESVAKENAEETKTDDKGLPGFWLTVMKNNDVLTEKVQKRDEKALKFLKDIKWSRIDDPEGFKLETEIEWYPGKCLTQKILKKTNARPIPKTKDCESFFNFFNALPAPEDDKEIAEILQYEIDKDYEIGCTIRDEIIPHAVSWFTGEAAQDNNFQDLVGDDDGEDEDEDEDEEEDDDDEEEDSKQECFTEIYHVYAAHKSGMEHRPSDQRMSRGYTQQGYHQPQLPTWGSPGGSLMQQQQQPGYGYMQPGSCPTQPPQYHMHQPAYGGYPLSYPFQSSNQQTQQTATGTGYEYYGQQQELQLSRGYTQQGYHQPRPPTWGPPGGSQLQQQPGYGYMQPGSYPTQPLQYYMYQPAYGGYPSSYPFQSSNQQTQQTATGIGYDYYGQQQQPQQQTDGRSADNNSYNYSQPPPNYNSQGSYGDPAYSQPTSGQQQGYGQVGYSGGYQTQPASTAQSGYDHQQGYGSNPAYPPQDG